MFFSAFVVVIQLSGPAALKDIQAFRAGQAAYNNFEFQRAADQFRRVEREPRLSREERVDLHVWQAMAHAQLGDWDAARAALRRAWELKHDLRLPRQVPPKLQTLLAEIRATKFSAAPRTVVPAGAGVATSDSAKANAPESAWYLDGLGGALLGGGVAVAAVGGAVYGTAFAAASSAMENLSSHGHALDMVWLQPAGLAAVAIGTALLIGGGARYALIAHEDGTP